MSHVRLRYVLLIALAVIALVITMLYVAVSSGHNQWQRNRAPTSSDSAGVTPAKSSDPSTETTSHTVESPDPSYWTDERMRDAQPVPRPTPRG